MSTNIPPAWWSTHCVLLYLEREVTASHCCLTYLTSYHNVRNILAWKKRPADLACAHNDYNLANLNSELRCWLAEIANRLVHGTTHEQVLLRFDEDLFSMQPIDGRPPYPYMDDEQRKVARDAYVSWQSSELSAAAHLIHGSSEGRFRITWCPGKLTQEEMEDVGFEYGDLREMLTRYDPEKLAHGNNTMDREEVFFIANPGLGLWAHKSRLGSD